MRIDVSLVQQVTLRDAIFDSLERAGYEFEQVDFWKSISGSDVSSLYKNTLITAELEPLAKLFSREEITKWGRQIRLQSPFFLVYLKKLVDQKHSSSITEILQVVSGRMKVVNLWDKDIRVQKQVLGEWVAKIARLVDPSVLIEIRVSRRDKSLWLQFGDGLTRAITWKSLPFGRRTPRLIMESAEIVDDGWTLAFQDTSNQIYEVDSEVLRMLVSPEFKKEIEEEDKQARRNLGERLRTWREKRMLSQVELSERSGIAQAAISRIEKGYHHPRLDTLRKYATALELDVPTLLEGPE